MVIPIDLKEILLFLIRKVTDKKRHRRKRIDFSQHVRINKNIVVQTLPTDYVKRIFSFIDHHGLIRRVTASLFEKRDLDNFHGTRRKVNIKPVLEITQLHIIIKNVGDIVAILQNSGHLSDITLPSTRKMACMVINSNTYFTQS